MKRVDEILKTIALGTSRGILKRLAEKPMTVGELRPPPGSHGVRGEDHSSPLSADSHHEVVLAQDLRKVLHINS